MSITVEDIVALQYEGLRSVGSKIVYLTIQKELDETGWASLSFNDLAGVTGLTNTGVANIIKRMQNSGLIEVRRDRSTPFTKNQYRIIDPE